MEKKYKDAMKAIRAESGVAVPDSEIKRMTRKKMGAAVPESEIKRMEKRSK